MTNSGCQKEFLKVTSFEGESKGTSLTPQMAQLWFESNYGKSKVVAPPRDFGTTNGDSDFYLNETFNVTPKWTSSKISTYLQVAPVVIVPVEPITFLDSRNLNYALVCFIDSTQNINARLQIYKATEKYKKEHTSYDVKTFSGMFFQIGLEGKIERIYGLNDGQFTSNLKLKKPELNSGNGTNKNSLTTRTNWQGCWGCGSVPGYTENFPLRCFFCTLGFGENNDEITYDGTNSNYFYGSLGFGYPSTNIYPSATGSFDAGSNGSSGSSNSDYSGSNTWGLSNEFDNSMFDINAELYAQQNKQNYVLTTLNPTGSEQAFLNSNTLIYNQLYDYLVQGGDFIEKNNIAKLHLQQLMENSGYFNANQQMGFQMSVLINLDKYVKAGFSVQEFANLLKDQSLFQQVDAFLNKYSFSLDAVKIIKIHENLYNNDAEYRAECIASGKIPAPLIIWILKAAGETIVDLGIDLAFGYLTGQPPGFWDEALNFGSNLIGTGEIGKVAKIAKYTAKISEMVEKVKLIRGGLALADKLKSSGDKLVKVLEEVSFLSEPHKSWQKVMGAIDNVIGAAYEARIALSKGAALKGVGLANKELTDIVGISLDDLATFASRRGEVANDLEIDIAEEIGGVLSLGQAKAGEFIGDAYSSFSKFPGQFKKQFYRTVEFALYRYQRTGQNTVVSYYVRDISNEAKTALINKARELGVTLNIFIQQ